MREVQSPYGIPGDRLWVREPWRLSSWDWTCFDATVEFKAGGERRSDEVERLLPDDFEDWLQREVDRHEKAPGVRVVEDGSYDGRLECDDPSKLPWRPSIFLPRWASRLTLDLTGVRMERVQEISDEDIAAEGFVMPPNQLFPNVNRSYKLRHHFAAGWDRINGHRHGASWAANPWVWRLEFPPFPSTQSVREGCP